MTRKYKVVFFWYFYFFFFVQYLYNFVSSLLFFFHFSHKATKTGQISVITFHWTPKKKIQKSWKNKIGENLHHVPQYFALHHLPFWNEIFFLGCSLFIFTRTTQKTNSMSNFINFTLDLLFVFLVPSHHQNSAVLCYNECGKKTKLKMDFCCAYKTVLVRICFEFFCFIYRLLFFSSSSSLSTFQSTFYLWTITKHYSLIFIQWWWLLATFRG